MFDIFEFEKKYAKELSEIEEWNYLRNDYRAISSYSFNKNQKINKLEEFKNIFYGFKNWFKRYDYLFFSDTGSRKNINNEMYNIFVDGIINSLDKKKSLLIEVPIPKHYKNVNTLNIVSRRLIDLLTVVLIKFDRNQYSNTFLEDINQRYDLKISYKNLIRIFNVRYKIYKLWFRIIKPKYIFLTCFYDKQYIVKAASELNIQTIDIQHGLIGYAHSAYFGDNWLDKSYLPDMLLVYGENDKERLSISPLLDNKNIYPIGNFYLEYLKNNFLLNNQLKNKLDAYKLTIGVSLQWTVEDNLILFIKNVAKKMPYIGFVLIPRKYDKKYANLLLSDNIIFFPNLDCYQTILHCQVHCTVYSTCALEAPALGIPNILINIDNLTKEYLNDIIDNNAIINTENEFQDKISYLIEHNKENIIENKDYKIGYKDNIKNFLRILE